MSLPLCPTPSAYQTAYEVLNPDPNSTGEDRRAVERLPFCFVQRIAAYDGQEKLADLRFFPVQCRDISRRGIAFLLPGQLGFSRLVVELGSDSERMYFEAEAVNCRHVEGAPVNDVDRLLAAMERTGKEHKAVFIGCRFKSKLEFADS